MGQLEPADHEKSESLPTSLRRRTLVHAQPETNMATVGARNPFWWGYEKHAAVA